MSLPIQLVKSHNRISKPIRKATSQWNVRGIPRLLYASRQFFLGKDPQLFELDNQLCIYLDPNDYVHCMMFYNRYSREILNVFRHFVRPGDTVIDVGAHVGFFSLYLAKLVTNLGHVYSFEPDPRAREFLLKSVNANRMDWVKVMDQALSAQNGSIDFYLAKGLGSSSAVKSVQQQGAEQTVVSTTSLDDLIDAGYVKNNVTMVKIDIEGLELDAIRGMKRLLKTGRPIMIIEVNKEMLEARGESPSNLFELLQSLGYTIEALAKPRRGRYTATFQTIPINYFVQQEGYYDVLCVPN